MELAISTCYDYRVPIEQSIEHIGMAGFRLISLGGREDHSRFQKDPGRSRLAEIVAKAGLKIDTIHAPYDPTADLTQPEDVLRHSALIEMRRCIAACKELGTSTLIMHLNFFRPTDISERLKRIKESMAEILEYAHSNGVKIAAENLPDDNSLIILKYALDIFDDEYLGLCFDSGHAALHQNAMELLDKYRNRLYALHLHDNDGKSDLHQLPFEGIDDLPNLAAQLNKGESICPITIESKVTHSGYKTPEAFLAHAYEDGNRFREMLKT
ncbi:MAG: sugar phosphate isomerase/epimerase [candidate division Zixibacteria bacterium]|nr:sugar phosphate isomerase/epimerase [candidate division Zixibacteria bacterium]